MSNAGSPNTKNLVFQGRDKAAEVALRRQLQEREKELKLEAKRKEQEDKLRRIAEQKNHELLLKAKLKAQRELEKAKAVLDRRAAQLEQDRAKKQTILEKAHSATSRTAQILPKKVFAFGSSTPRELSYLERLSKDQKQYDKKLTPPEGSNGVSPSGSPPRQSPAKKGSVMTASLYVPPKTTLHTKSGFIPRNPASIASKNSPLKNSAMSQSMYVPKTAQNSRRSVLPTQKPSVPKRVALSTAAGKKPPIPARKGVTESAKPKPIEINKPDPIHAPVSKPATQTEPIEQKTDDAQDEIPVIQENAGPDASPFVEMMAEPVVDIKQEIVENEELVAGNATNEQSVEDVGAPINRIIEGDAVDEINQESRNEEVGDAVNQQADNMTEEILDSVLNAETLHLDTNVTLNEPELVAEVIDVADGNQNVSAANESIGKLVDALGNLDLSNKQLDEPQYNATVDGEDTSRLDKDGAKFNVDDQDTRIESPDSGNALSASSSPKESDSENTEIATPAQSNNIKVLDVKSMERRARLSEIMSKVRETGHATPVKDANFDTKQLAKQILEERRQGRVENGNNSGSDLDLSIGNSTEDKSDIAAPKTLSLAEEIREAERLAMPSDVLPGQPIYDNYKANAPEDPAQTF